MTDPKLIFVALTACWLGAAGLSGQSASPATGANKVTLRVGNAQAAAEIQRAGGELVADYGAFSVVRCDAPLADQFSSVDGVERTEDENTILLVNGAVDTTAPAAVEQSAVLSPDPGLRLIQFAGPIAPEWYAALAGTGVRILTYIPHNAYLVYGHPQELANMRNLAASAPFVRWEGVFLPAYKIRQAPAVAQAQAQVQGETLYSVQLVMDAQVNPGTLQLIDARRTGPIRNSYQLLQYWNLVVGLPPTSLAELGERPDVVHIAPYDVPTPNDEIQAIVVAGGVTGNGPTGPGYLDWLTSMGFTQEQFDASGFIVDLTDSGIDNGTTQPNHSALYVRGERPGVSRVMYNRLEGSGDLLAGCDGHGTLNAHIIGGYSTTGGYPHQDGAGFQYDLGVAPFARLGSSVIFGPFYTFPVFPEVTSHAYEAGARISSNSWGTALNYAYNSDSQAFDYLVRDAQPEGTAFGQAGNQELVVVFSCGNNGPTVGTITPPGNAKNVLTVGAAENFRAIGGSDGCSVGDVQSDNVNQIASFQSRGPTSDGRHKPDLVAPGTHVTGGLIQQLTDDPLGAADACFHPTSICGAVPPNAFFPAGQQLYTISSGTSHACPAVSGGAALIRQFFVNQGWNPPSPAMTKCLLMNSARYMTGVAVNDTLPSPHQGMGEMDLHQAFERGTSVPSIMRDQLPEDVFTATGQNRVISGSIADSGKPARVTLVWTDAPGSPVGAVERNDLDLTVIAGGQSYKGNVFSGAVSVVGGNADRKNNVESVFLPLGLTGEVTITISASNINSDGVPNNVDPLDQDFALLAYNIRADDSVVPVISGAFIAEEGCLPANGVPDPDEAITLAVSLSNVGVLDASNVYASILPTEQIEPISGQIAYGELMANGPAQTRPIQFRSRATCGQNALVRLRVWDSLRDLGVLLINLPGAAQGSGFAESFDAVVLPALPPGWGSQTMPEGAGYWQSQEAIADSAPNAVVFVVPQSPVSGTLISPPILIHGAAAELSFNHRYSLGTGSSAQLLVSVSGGEAQEVAAAGGVFEAGAYDVLSDSVPDGYWGWTGESMVWKSTLVRLPSTMAGHEIQLQWKVSSSGLETGSWYVDSIALTDHAACCEKPRITEFIGPTPASTQAGPLVFKALFTEAVAGLNAIEDLDIVTTGSVSVGAASFTGSGAGPYTIELSQLTGQGTLAVAIRENACADLDNNGNEASTLSPAAFVDDVPVTCVITRRDPSPTAASSVRFGLEFSEPVEGLTQEHLLITSTTTRAIPGALGGSGAEYEIEIQNIVGNGSVCLQVPSGIVQDEQGNDNPASDPVCYTIEQVQPSTRFDYQLVATSSPTSHSAGSLPSTATAFRVGEPFHVELWARQENHDDSGLTCVYTDLSYDADKLQYIAQMPDSRFAEPIFLGLADHSPGFIRDVGGCTLERPGDDGPALTSQWVRITDIMMLGRKAPCVGEGCLGATARIGLGAAQAESAAYGEGAVDTGAIVYGDLIVRIVPGSRADLDRDGDVDTDDMTIFASCSAGPEIALAGDCAGADLDEDGDADQSDFGTIQECFTGRDQLVDPDCGNL